MIQIPKILHFIWLGDKEFPSQYVQKWQSMYHDFEVRIWTDKNDVSHIIPDKLKPYYNLDIGTPVFKADILRYCLLEYYGGIYIDTDFEPLRKIPYSFLNFNFLGGIQNNNEVAIGFIGSSNNSEILQDVISQIPQSIDRAKEQNDFKSYQLHKITGPTFFTSIVKKYFNHYDYFFFTSEYFYPFWFDNKPKESEKLKEKYPLAYAAHHWNMSWVNI